MTPRTEKSVTLSERKNAPNLHIVSVSGTFLGSRHLRTVWTTSCLRSGARVARGLKNADQLRSVLTIESLARNACLRFAAEDSVTVPFVFLAKHLLISVTQLVGKPKIQLQIVTQLIQAKSSIYIRKTPHVHAPQK